MIKQQIYFVICFLFCSCIGFGQGGATVGVEKGLESVNKLLEAAKYVEADSLLTMLTPRILQSEDAEHLAEVKHLGGILALEQGDYRRGFFYF